MANFNIKDYKIVGTLTQGKSFSALIASKNNDDDNLYLINKFPHNKEHEKLFKEFFSYYSSKQKSKDMDNFFADSHSFYVVFNYRDSESIKEKFSAQKNTMSYDKRCIILKEILLKLDSLSNMPISALACITDISNICIDKNNSITILYNLNNIFENQSADMQDIFKNISIIIETTLQNELKEKYTKALKLVVKNCKNNVYKSIPQLIVELEKSENDFDNTNIFSKIKKYMSQNKGKLKKYYKIGGLAAVIIFVLFIYNLLFLKGNHIVNGSTKATVGNIEYLLESMPTDVGIDPHMIEFSRPSSSTSIDLTLPEGIELSSEDYIVQNGDTLQSICENYYGSKDFVSAVRSFNNIEEENLSVGMVILLPDAQGIYQYFFS